MDILHVRVSSFPLLAECSPAAFPAAVSIAGPRGVTDMGTCGHEVIAPCIASGRMPTAEDVESVANRFSVDKDELDQLVHWGWGQWKKLSGFFPNPATEVELEWFDAENQIQVSGHLDVVALADRKRAPLGMEFRVADHKSGRLDKDHSEQLKGYCLLGLKTWQSDYKLDRAYAATLRWREQRVDGAEYTRQQLEDWWGEFARRLRKEGDRYRPGAHCGTCPRGVTCDAKTAWMKQALAIVSNGIDGPLTPVQVGQLYDGLKLVKPFVEKTWELVKATVNASEGRALPLGDGRKLRIKDQAKREIDVRKGIDVLKAALGDMVVVDLLKISKGDVETAAKAKAGQGQKGKAAAQLIRELEQAGALRTTYSDRLECERMADDGEGTTGAAGAGTTPAAITHSPEAS